MIEGTPGKHQINEIAPRTVGKFRSWFGAFHDTLSAIVTVVREVVTTIYGAVDWGDRTGVW